ncbi:ribonuclease HI [Desulfosudis oleivorans]|uniref:ribonuclease H n=1 Tax=Desulfosudis oleivorans (strain DSM 6200 / JCM 39069 / Hxd3) TaxID=96561 RepID=A8ZTA6_DESOH|nr:ribonuclease H [Desulfosudis oleivorans]ABW67789.1 ribonuclease H [Desulfosudis oleivorans Hxd3]
MSTDTPGWKRMAFKNNKVWVETGPAGDLLVQDGKVRIKYQLDQPHEYRVHKESLRPLDRPGAAPATSTVKSPAKKKPVPAKNFAGNGTEVAAAMAEKDAIQVFTDGAASGNPGPAGIGVLLIYGNSQKTISRYIGHATNNIAELKAIEAALLEIKNKKLPVRLFTDSAYSLGALTLGWKAQKNVELIAGIQKLMRTFSDLKIFKVKGHAGMAENETADRLATEAIQKLAE